jgi:hypothetical protein
MNAQLYPAPITGLSTYAPGIYPDVPAEVYHRRELGVASAGVLRRLAEQTPAHYRAWVDGTDDGDTPAMAFGRAYHDRVLLPGLFAKRYVSEPVDAPARPTGAMRNAKSPSPSSIERVAFWSDWDARNAGKVVLPADSFALIDAMHAALMRDSYIAELFAEGESEITLCWDDEETRLRCKARADRWNRRRRFMADLKTTDDASERAFGRSVVNYGYDITHAHYSEGAKACGEPIERYILVAQEKKPPYLAAVYELDAAGESRGYELRKRSMDTMAQCLQSGIWPGYPRGAQPLSLPGWAIANEMEISYVD